MRYCKRCVQPDTRPGIRFDDEGICPACRFAENAPEVDWEARRAELEEIAEYGRAHASHGYDCLIGVSGGKDSTRQAMFVRDELGLNPLLVNCAYPPEQLADRGAHNIANLIELGFDMINYCPAPGVWKRLQWESLTRYGNLFKSCEMALYASAPRVSLGYRIPLIFLGENPAQTVGELCLGTVDGNANRVRYGNTIASGLESVMPRDMGAERTILYRFPTDAEMENSMMRIVYLGYYIRDFGKRKNAEFSMRHGMQVRPDPPEDIGDITGHEALDEDFVIVNQMLKYIKLGFGKVVDQVSEEIRLGNMTREEGVRLARLYDGRCAPRFVERLCRYFGISRAEFDELVERFRNRDIWRRTDGRWHLAVDFDNTPLG
ncbi:N-acetyl sugar amidotransferase [Pseudodesulfovibrio tunisiensis]|uniref:N-acetyl sugar amidotransferase n=1 Tax=Pseudodesulfovibrio tunisiensis TaxID=463192 RepID=UPI001FB2C057|nr:N-acetyl sugar amidotransferase [Pseudodesulfovibrio tunisiensis]